MIDPTTTWAPSRRRPAVEHLVVLAPGAGVDGTRLPSAASGDALLPPRAAPA